MRYLVPIIVVTATLFALDFYVYRNWRRFARGRSGTAWTLPLYRVLMAVMPFALPLYLNLYSWWEVEPRLARALFFALWGVYYVPKAPIAAVLLVKDAARLAAFIRRRVRERDRLSAAAEGTEFGLSTAEEGREVGGTSRVQRRDKVGGMTLAQRTDEVGGMTRAQGREAIGGMTRAEFLRRLGWSAAAVPFIATGYGVLRTVYDFSIRRVDVPLAGLPRAFEGLTIAQLSDLHAGSLFNERPMWDAVAITNELKPDVIAITGDFVNHDTAELDLVLPALRALKADVGVFGCLGNHDHYADTGRLVEQIGATPIDLLVNRHRTLSIDGATLHMIGTDNTGFRQHYADLPGALAGIEPANESLRILLAHDPTFWDSHVRPDHQDIDLMLCGHTHGGQFGFEFGPFRWSLAQVRYERWAGLYNEPRLGGGVQFLYVNRGLGTVGPPLRLGIPPEVTLLTLRRA